MVALAIDTTGAACVSAAIADSGRGALLAEARADMTRGHADAIIPQIKAVLRSAERDWAAIGLIAVCVGPGSFTGVRVGVAAARGLSLALAAPAIGVSAFEAYAAADPPAETLFVVGKPALCAWAWASAPTMASQGSLERAPLADAAALIGPAALSGDPKWRPAPVSPLAIARAAAVRAAMGAPVAPPTPYYLRPPDAEPSSRRPPPRLDRSS